jgi:hypothetical protein
LVPLADGRDVVENLASFPLCLSREFFVFSIDSQVR